jgi:uncharacterized protein (DUF697 family)
MIDAMPRVVGPASWGAAAVAAVLSPIPLADEVLLFPALLGVGAAVGRARGVRLRALPWGAFAATAAIGLTARAGINLAVSYLPGIAAVANATTAYALTYAFGAWAHAACADPSRARPPSPAQLVDAIRSGWRAARAPA